MGRGFPCMKWLDKKNIGTLWKPVLSPFGSPSRIEVSFRSWDDIDSTWFNHIFDGDGSKPYHIWGDAHSFTTDTRVFDPYPFVWRLLLGCHHRGWNSSRQEKRWQSNDYDFRLKVDRSAPAWSFRETPLTLNQALRLPKPDPNIFFL